MTETIITSTLVNAPQAKQLAQQLTADFVPLKMITFESGEFYFEAPESLTGKTIILFQHILFPVNETIIQLALGMNAIRQRHAHKLILLIPYLPYSRQDRLHKPGAAIGASVIAQLLQTATPDALLVLDLHSLKIADYYNFPVINLESTSLIITDIQKRFSMSDICLVSPDAGGADRTQTIAAKLNVPCLSLTKERLNFNELVIHNPGENFSDKICIFIDDMIDTGTTLLKAANTCLKAQEIHVYATHGIFSHQPSLKKLSNRFDSLTITDSIPQTKLLQNMRILPCWELFLTAISTKFLA